MVALLIWSGSTPFGAAGSNSTSLLAILRMSGEVQGRSGSRANIRASWLVAALLVRRDNRAASCLGSRPNRASADSTLSHLPLRAQGQTETDPFPEARVCGHGGGPLNQLLAWLHSKIATCNEFRTKEHRVDLISPPTDCAGGRSLVTELEIGGQRRPGLSACSRVWRSSPSLVTARARDRGGEGPA